MVAKKAIGPYFQSLRAFAASVSGEQPYPNQSRGVISPQVQEAIRREDYKPRHHPGHFGLPIVDLPEPLWISATKQLSFHELKPLKLGATRLADVLSMRKPPMSAKEMYLKALQVKSSIIDHFKQKAEVKGLKWPPEDETDEEQEKRNRMLERMVTKKLKSTVYNWRPIVFNTEAKCLMYLIARLPPNYAVTLRVLREIKQRVPDFVPTTVFDYGSGLGTLHWVCQSLWPDAMKEMFMVDTSSDMNDLAASLLQNNFGDIPKEITMRQFLPASSDRQYDLVFSAYSLMECPEAEQRVYVVENLWRKTSDFLVIVENGSKAGHHLILEARDHLLKLTKESECVRDFLFAPCPHDLLCPRAEGRLPCNFAAMYYPFKFVGTKRNSQCELFSYIVFRKGQGTKQSFCSRVVDEPLFRRKHIWCKVCSERGLIEKLVMTKRQSGSELYRIAKTTTWGDLLPAVPHNSLQPGGEDDSDSNRSDKLT
ncbi:Rsm22 domain containing protein [Trichuris trichiura]|uniref:Rsm22 domain containing protein n=1 Tax=Trichuris trichiura TaxID=36087 RepID=A0A077Z431_TRITR|nr:Rsm22 domain containing protein [Trichuris trichiura]